eukprot:3481962-Alexandrium_andersonii.AAC.1
MTRTQQREWWNVKSSAAPAPCAVAEPSCHSSDGEDDAAFTADPDTEPDPLSEGDSEGECE